MDNPASAASPAPRQVLAALVDAIATASASSSTAAVTSTSTSTASTTTPANPLRRIPPDQRPLVATLHVLFPALLLPALDLLDRRHVVRWEGERSEGVPLYQVCGGGSDRPYVVHLRAWHCTCAAFALLAVEETADEDDDGGHVAKDEDGRLPATLARFPLALSTPPCKHLLACLLAEAWTAVGLAGVVVAGTDEQDGRSRTSPETLAGIVAGVL